MYIGYILCEKKLILQVELDVWKEKKKKAAAILSF